MKLLITLFVGLCLCAWPGEDTKAQFQIAPGVEFEVATKVVIRIARPKFSCEKGLWICFVEVMVEGKVKGKTLASREAVGEILLPRNREGVYVRIYDGLPPGNTGANAHSFYAEAGEEYELPPEVCEKLGVDRLVFYPGDYEIIDIDEREKLVHIDALVEH